MADCFSSEEQQDSQQSRDLQLNTQAVFQSAAIAVHSIKLLNALHLCSTCIIDQCVLPSLKFQLRTAAFSSKCELKLLGFEHGLWRRSCSILRRSESLKLSMQI